MQSTEFLGHNPNDVIIGGGLGHAARYPDEPTLVSLTLPGQASQVRVARRWLARLVADVPTADEIVLAASELAANAVSHSDSGLRGGMFTIRAAIGPDMVRVEVADAGGPWRAQPGCEEPGGGDAGRDDPCRDDPGRGHPGGGDAGRDDPRWDDPRWDDPRWDDPRWDDGGGNQRGRGLAIVASLASAWGIDGDQAGRTAWCELSGSRTDPALDDLPAERSRPTVGESVPLAAFHDRGRLSVILAEDRP